MRDPQFLTIPRGTEHTKCRWCRRADVYWITTASGAKLAVDAEVPGGIEPGLAQLGRGIAHFSTCPESTSHHARTPGTVGEVDTSVPQLDIFEGPLPSTAEATALIVQHGGGHEGRILMHMQDAREACWNALHKTYPVSFEDPDQVALYRSVKAAVKSLEQFYRAYTF